LDHNHKLSLRLWSGAWHGPGLESNLKNYLRPDPSPHHHPGHPAIPGPPLPYTPFLNRRWFLESSCPVTIHGWVNVWDWVLVFTSGHNGSWVGIPYLMEGEVFGDRPMDASFLRMAINCRSTWSGISLPEMGGFRSFCKAKGIVVVGSAGTQQGRGLLSMTVW